MVMVVKMMKMVALIGMVMLISIGVVCGLPSSSTLKRIHRVNSLGHHLGIVVPNAYEMDPLLNNTIFQSYSHVPTIDIGGNHDSLCLLCLSPRHFPSSHSCAFWSLPHFLGRRFYIGTIESHRVIIVMSGLSMVNSTHLYIYVCIYIVLISYIFDQHMYVEGKSMNILFAWFYLYT